jgi:hypothetical protein
MAALVQDRKTPKRDGEEINRPVAASTKIFAGSLVAINASGYLVPGSVSTTLKVQGRAEEYVDNSAGANGDLTCKVRRGVFLYDNDGTVALADIGKTAYIVDDQTVADNDGSEARSAAGVIEDVDSDGVWVRIV